MPCTSPRTVGFLADGKTISWSPKNYSKEYATFQLPCGKCLECRLQYAREWAIRCVHESQMHEQNSFVTLTYEKLVSPKLVYEDFQLFMKRLRKTQNEPIGFFVTGEYGDENKRPHWHAIIFNWRPSDCIYKYSNHRGDKVYSSANLDRLWTHGITEVGSVTIESAGYCARYAAKKLVHGKDDEHEYHPVSKKSSKHAIGKKWLEKYWPDIFNYGQCILKDGQRAPIPRYYQKWLKQNHPEHFAQYITNTRREIIEEIEKRYQAEKEIWERNAHERKDAGKSHPLTRNEIRKIITQQKFNQLQDYLKL